MNPPRIACEPQLMILALAAYGLWRLLTRPWFR